MNDLADGIVAAHTSKLGANFSTVLKCKLFCIILIFLQHNMKTIKQNTNQTTNMIPE
jgi:hypothetical protein